MTEQVQPPPAVQPGKIAFRLHRACIFFVAGAPLAFAAYVLARYGLDAASRLGAIVLPYCVALGLVTLLAYVGFLVFGRSNRVASVAFCSLLTLWTIGQGLVLDRAVERRRQQAAADVSAERVLELRDEILEKSREQDHEGAHAAVDKLEDALAKKGEGAGHEAAAARAFARILAEIQAAGKRYDDAVAAFSAAGGPDVSGVRSVEDVEARLALIGDMTNTNDALETVMKGIARKARAELEAEGLTGRHLDANHGAFVRNANIATQLEFRQSQRDAAHALTRMLTILRDEFGSWTYNAEQFAVEFESDEVAAQYNDAVEALNAAAEREAVLQEKLLRPKR
jgi:hypothetical protein